MFPTPFQFSELILPTPFQGLPTRVCFQPPIPPGRWNAPPGWNRGLQRHRRGAAVSVRSAIAIGAHRALFAPSDGSAGDQRTNCPTDANYSQQLQ